MQTQLVLAAPERFASGAFRRALASREVGLFVVDEAHCVAEWGHDFRPDYLRLHEAIESLGRPPVMAATATATPGVAEEIAMRLGLRDQVSVRSGFDRPNLTFDVATVEGKGAIARKRAALMHVISDPDARPAIVYCGTRKDTDKLAGEISRSGIRAVAYHAGMTPEKRRASQLPSWTAGPRWSWRPTPSAWAWTRPMCGPSPTGHCRRASRPTTRRPAAAGVTGSPPERCCWPRGWTWAG